MRLGTLRLLIIRLHLSHLLLLLRTEPLHQFLLVLLHLLHHVLVDLDPLLKIQEGTALIEEDLESSLQPFVVIGSCRDMHPSVRENRILRVHQFVKQDPQ